MSKQTKGKWKLAKLMVRWFCRNCHQKGLCEINAHGARVTYDPPTIADVKQIVQTTCHTDCKQPDIRLHYETKNRVKSLRLQR